MLRIIRKLLAGDSVAALSPRNVVASPPPEAALANRMFVAVYTDGQGFSTERRLTCRAVYRSDGKVYMDAVCQERRALRTFRVDRIVELYDGKTGEDLGDPASVLVPWGPDRPLRMVQSASDSTAPEGQQPPRVVKPAISFKEPVRLVVDVGADGEVTEVIGTLVEYSFEERSYGVRSYLSLRPDAPYMGSRRVIKMDMVPEVTGYDMKTAVNVTCCETGRSINDFYEWATTRSNALK